MISKQLLNYIEREDKLGRSRKEVENILTSAGWHKDAVSDALDIYYKKDKQTEGVEVESPAPEGVETPTKSIEKKKKRVRSIFLIILSLVLGAAIMMVFSMYFINKTTTSIYTTPKGNAGFEAQKIDDGKRIAEVLEIQKSLEKYYNEHKSYPENIKSMTDFPTTSSELNYTYTPIGSPPQSYTLSVEVKNTEDGEFKIDGGFMTLKNKQGTK